MPLLPLDQHDLSHHQRGDEDQHHLGVDGLVTPVLHVEALVLRPVNNNNNEKKKTRQETRRLALVLCASRVREVAHFQVSLWVIVSRSSWSGDRNNGLTGQFHVGQHQAAPTQCDVFWVKKAFVCVATSVTDNYRYVTCR